MTTSQGAAITGQAAINLSIACGADPSPYRPFVGIGSIIRKDQSGSSNFNAFEALLRHSVGGLQLNAAYTYSHSIDNSSDNADAGFLNAYNLNAYRASSNFDQRHVFNLGYVYDLPFLRGKSLVDKLLGGWEWSGITNIQSGTHSAFTTGGRMAFPATMPEWLIITPPLVNTRISSAIHIQVYKTYLFLASGRCSTIPRLSWRLEV